jgi:arylsulfatase A-like enzyme
MGGYKRGAPNNNKSNRCGGYFAPYCNPRLIDGPEGEYLPERLAAETTNFLDTIGENPFFACLSFYLVHTPLQAKEETINKYQEKRNSSGLDSIKEYDISASWIQYATQSNSYKERLLQSHPVYGAMVESLDENIGKVINKLKEKGLYENTIIVFTSDNGGLSTAEGSPTTNTPLRAGKGWLYEGGIRVPYVVRYPGNNLAGTKNNTPVAGMDIMPTLLSLSGIEYSSENIDGIDFSPALKGEEVDERELDEEHQITLDKASRCPKLPVCMHQIFFHLAKTRHDLYLRHLSCFASTTNG